MKKHAHAIKNALNGIMWGLQTQPNYRIHIVLSFIVIAAAFFFRVSYTEWLILLVAIIMGFVLETVNTAIEQLGDAIDKNYNEYIKRAKDSSAGAMLLFSFGAIIIAGWIFIPKIIDFVLY